MFEWTAETGENTEDEIESADEKAKGAVIGYKGVLTVQTVYVHIQRKTYKRETIDKKKIGRIEVNEHF